MRPALPQWLDSVVDALPVDATVTYEPGTFRATWGQWEWRTVGFAQVVTGPPILPYHDGRLALRAPVFQGHDGEIRYTIEVLRILGAIAPAGRRRDALRVEPDPSPGWPIQPG
jgi:hypothetical protein